MKLSARNVLKGKVTAVKEGAVMTEVVVDVGGNEVVAVITAASAANLQVAPGKEVYAVIKSTDILLMVD
jgi:molybdopterin-binding protein